MCGRYTLIRLSDFTDLFPWIRHPEQELPERFNIAPTQPVAVVPNDGKDQVQYFHWGLVPSWAKDVAIGSKMINARVETLPTKPAFRTALKRRRCLIPASGFYEWKKNANGTKQPMYIRMKDKRPFAFAGLWETWRDDKGNELPSCTIITGQPNALVRDIHDRMAIILREENYRAWLDPKEKDADELAPLLAPYPAEKMEAFPISKAVNNPKNESSSCIEPLTLEESDAPQAPYTPTVKSSKRSKRDDGPSLFS